MPQNRQYYRKVKYPDKVAKPKRLVFVRIFLFCSVGIKIQYFPTAPFLYYDMLFLFCSFKFFCAVASISLILLSWFTSEAPGS